MSKITNHYTSWGGWFNREIKLLGLFLTLISFSNLIFGNNTFALYTPALSASVDQTNLQINGNQVINSTNKTTEIPLNLTVNTNNKTGYTATLNSETDETALVNNDSTYGAKINSISTSLSLNNLPNNSWGYKFGSSTNYAPIPALSIPAQILQTTGKTSSNETSSIKIGMKLSDNLESGRYDNKLIFSVVTNPYTPKAVMTKGWDFNTKLRSLETATNKIEHFKKSTVAPAASVNAVNIEDEESDYEIKLWLDPTDKTAYYYTEPEKVYLNTNSSGMFAFMSNLATLNLSNFDTSKVTNMHAMFYGMTKLAALDLSNFNTSQVQDMSSMFSGVFNLITTLNLSSFDTSKVRYMTSMFSGMPNLTTLDISNFNTSQVINMSYMLYLRDEDKLMDKLEKIYVNNDFDTTKLTSFEYMFSNRKKLRGGNGSYLTDPLTADKSWLRVDRPGVWGYFTRKP